MLTWETSKRFTPLQTLRKTTIALSSMRNTFMRNKLERVNNHLSPNYIYRYKEKPKSLEHNCEQLELGAEIELEGAEPDLDESVSEEAG
jgi:hypothetical protein